MAETTQLKQNGENIFPKVKVANDLITDDTETPLSAKQGKVLNENKLDKLGSEYHFLNDVKTPEQGAENITAKFDSITLDGSKSGKEFTLTIPKADIENNKAGLLTKEILNTKSKVEASAETVPDVGTVHSLKIDGVSWNIPEGGTGGSSVIPSEEKVEGAKTAQSLKIDNVNWNLPTEQIIEVELQSVEGSETDFEATITEDEFNKLKARTHRLKCVARIEEVNAEFVTYATDISYLEMEERGTTVTMLFGFSASDNGSTVFFDIRFDGKFYKLRASAVNFATHDDVYYLQERIDSLENFGLKVGTWDCITGEPAQTILQHGHYYNPGEYFIIVNSAEKEGVNIMPSGEMYDEQPSREEYRGEKMVENGMFWYYRGSGEWTLLDYTVFNVSFGHLAGDISENPQLQYALEKLSRPNWKNVEGLSQVLDDKADRVQLTDGSISFGQDDIGGTNRPVYINKGKPVEIGTQLGSASSKESVDEVSETFDDGLPTVKAVRTALEGKQDKKENMDLSNITLNGTHNQSPNFYAPTAPGLSGQLLGSDGTKPVWMSIASVLQFKGVKETLEEIEALTGEIGDVWYCIETDLNYAYAGPEDKWVSIGNNVDLSGYQTKIIGTEGDAGKLINVGATGEIAKVNDTVGANNQIVYINNGTPTKGITFTYGTEEPTSTTEPVGSFYMKIVE